MKNDVVLKKKGEFNLADEPWIILLSKDGKTEKKSLKEVFLEAQDFLDIGGEIRLQDAAMLRLLTAVSVKLLYTYDEHGEERPLLNRKDADRRFAAVWRSGRFSELAVTDYFAKWHDRFYLFDEKYPFYQIPLDGMPTEKSKDSPSGEAPVLDCGAAMTWIPIANINARVQRSGNKPYAPYKDLSEDRIWTMDYDEAARWLVFYIAYADCVAGKNRSATVGKLKNKVINAKLTLPAHGARVTPVGNNLFETVMLNSCLYYTGKRLYDSCVPAWERDVFDRSIEYNTVMPYDLPQIYTSQSRRLSFVRDGDKVTGLFASAGEAYADDFLWRDPTFMVANVKDKNDKDRVIRVTRHCTNSTDVWKEIGYITGSPGTKEKEGNDGAAIVKWVASLAGSKGIIPEGRAIPFRVTDISYKSMYCGIGTMIEDKILIGRRFLTDSDIQRDACSEIEKNNAIAGDVYLFGKDCSRCMNRGKKDEKKKNDLVGLHLKRRYMDATGPAFRAFISGDMSLKELRKAEYSAAERLAAAYIKENIWALLKGKRGEDGVNIGLAHGIFMGKIKKYKPEDE